MNEAEDLAQQLREEYGLTYACSVNLEGTINNMLHDGIQLDAIEHYLQDILDNVDFLPEEGEEISARVRETKTIPANKKVQAYEGKFMIDVPKGCKLEVELVPIDE